MMDTSPKPTSPDLGADDGDGSSEVRTSPDRTEQLGPVRRVAHTVRQFVTDPSSNGPASDWADARAGSGTEHPSLLPDGDTHLNVVRSFGFIDLSGFTAFTREHGPHRAVEVLGEFRRVTRNVAAKRGVRVAKWLGDGAMVVGVDQGPTLALGAHLIAHFARTDLRVRVGVATGTALLFEGDDYIGEPVNLAFKLCDAAQPGEMLADNTLDELPEWVSTAGNVVVNIRGIGPVDGIVRLQPALDHLSDPVATDLTDGNTTDPSAGSPDDGQTAA